MSPKSRDNITKFVVVSPNQRCVIQLISLYSRLNVLRQEIKENVLCDYSEKGNTIITFKGKEMKFPQTKMVHDHHGLII